jgi:hypothetical protein
MAPVAPEAETCAPSALSIARILRWRHAEKRAASSGRRFLDRVDRDVTSTTVLSFKDLRSELDP